MRRIVGLVLALALISVICLNGAAFADGISQISQWNSIVQIEACDGGIFGLRADGTVVCANANDSLAQADHWTNIRQLISDDGYYNHFLIGLKKDGMVVSTSKADLSQWRNITKIVTCKGYWIAGLRSDGTAVITRKNELCDGDNGWLEQNAWFDLTTWRDLVELVPLSGWTAMNALAGIHADGTVSIAAPSGYEYVKSWKNIVSVRGCLDGVFGIAGDGTLAAPPYVQDMYSENCSFTAPLSTWKNLAALYPGHQDDLFALTADGHVCAVHSNNEYPLAEAVKDWRNIKTLYPMYNNIIGLRTDGTVVWAGFDPPFAELTGWKDIKALEMVGIGTTLHVFGLKTDGTVVCMESNVY